MLISLYLASAGLTFVFFLLAILFGRGVLFGASEQDVQPKVGISLVFAFLSVVFCVLTAMSSFNIAESYCEPVLTNSTTYEYAWTCHQTQNVHPELAVFFFAMIGLNALLIYLLVIRGATNGN